MRHGWSRVLVVSGEPGVARALRHQLADERIDVEIGGLDPERTGALEGFRPDVVVSSFRMRCPDRDELLFCSFGVLPLAVCVLPRRPGDERPCRVVVRPWDVEELAAVLRKQFLAGGAPASQPVPEERRAGSAAARIL